ncbi:MAG: flagellar hook-basal body complex protein [Alphaproteobacteria bacterium]|nr:flagellar hook-basal body complex protein [Alphaproteobacteria bacterium]
MGIYGALATAVTGLRAQAFALELISGNIANSQTTGFKRIEADFVDLIPDAPPRRQTAGAVIAQARSTNDVQGDIVVASRETYLAVNGTGYFVVAEQIGANDGNSVFGGTDFYTRRGDFEIDRNGYLVNGGGYFLKGLPIDADTGNISGSVPQVIQLSNAFLPAVGTSRIDYQLNLPQLPKTVAYDELQPGSELMDAADFVATAPDVTATATGAALTGTDNAATAMVAGESMSVNVDGTAVIFDFFDGNAGAYAGANIGIDVQTVAAVDIDTALAAVQAGLRANGGAAAADATVALNGGNAEVTLGTNTTGSFNLTDGSTGLGLTDGTYVPIDSSLLVRVPEVQGSDTNTFLNQSIAGGAVTVYADNGSPVNVQLRWAKIDAEDSGGTDTWNMFYLYDGDAQGTDPAWINSGQDYVFGADGSLNPDISSVTLTGLEVNGVSLGNMVLDHGNNGVTQFSDANGTTQVTELAQNGYTAGEFLSVSVSNTGRILANYNNGQVVELAQVVTATFNAENQLGRLDGGIFTATSESGQPILNSDAKILGSSLENSNTDISEEFTKLIVTQQAYAAGTRIVSTSDEMLQEALNMVR